MMRILSCWMGYRTGWLRSIRGQRAKRRKRAWRCVALRSTAPAGRRIHFYEDGVAAMECRRDAPSRKSGYRAPVPPVVGFHFTGLDAAPLPNRQPARRHRPGEACGGGVPSVAGGRAGASI
jgi:hypothetical protein